MKNIIITILAFIAITIQCKAQTSWVSASQEEICGAAEVVIRFTVEDFSSIEAFQFPVTWNADYVTYLSRENVHPNLSFFLNTQGSTPGEMRVTWLNFLDNSPVTIPNGETLFSLRYQVLDPTQIIPITIGDAPINKIVTINGVSYTLGSTNGRITDCALPVEFSEFRADYNYRTKSAELYWATASESNRSEFIVQRSANGINFENIQSVKSRGNAAQGASYDFFDNHPLSGLNYYRLQYKDRDANTSFTEIVVVDVPVVENTFSIFPNPAQNRVVLQYSKRPEQPVSVDVYDLQGRKIRAIPIPAFDSTEISIDISSLPTGFYILKCTNNETNQVFVEKLVKN